MKGLSSKRPKGNGPFCPEERSFSRIVPSEKVLPPSVVRFTIIASPVMLRWNMISSCEKKIVPRVSMATPGSDEKLHVVPSSSTRGKSAPVQLAPPLVEKYVRMGSRKISLDAEARMLGFCVLT